ncbi:MAG: hypothetical protein WAT79_09745 [Saprospiraceae bacterium]
MKNVKFILMVLFLSMVLGNGCKKDELFNTVMTNATESVSQRMSTPDSITPTVFQFSSMADKLEIMPMNAPFLTTILDFMKNQYEFRTSEAIQFEGETPGTFMVFCPNYSNNELKNVLVYSQHNEKYLFRIIDIYAFDNQLISNNSLSPGQRINSTILATAM